MSGEIVCLMMTLRDQIKIYHWQTMSFPRHKATDDLVGKLDDNIDKFTEVYMGKYGRPKLRGRTATYTVDNLTDKKALMYVRECVKICQGPLMKGLSMERDSDLFTIRDEMLADLNQLLYLFTLH